MKIKRHRPLRFAIALLAFLTVGVSARQDEVIKKWEEVDFTKRALVRSEIEDLSLENLKILRGIIFGRHGRVFKDFEIKGYLAERPWYKPDPNFQNSSLNPIERRNLDLIRELEAGLHEFVEPGDMRWWQAETLTEEKLGEHSGAEWRILRAEIEAIHGKRFDDQPWLQTYFEERYWYRADPAYDPKRLSATERRNMTIIDTSQRKQRKVALSPGDMEHFQKVVVSDAMLDGLGLYELRLLRNEIYARRGRQFKTEWLANYFYSQPWYEPLEDASEPDLTVVERKNVDTIVAYEKKVKTELSTKPIPRGLLEGLFLEDARKLRQEIYARHGKVFRDKWLQKYFQSFDWYKANPSYSDAVLTAIEKQNIASIAAYEKKATSVLDAVEG
jgi:hypothetical protein